MNGINFTGYEDHYNPKVGFGLEMSLLEAKELIHTDDGLQCAICGLELEGTVHVDFLDGNADEPVALCCHCAKELGDRCNVSSEAYALKFCEITEDLPTFKWESVWRCTPEEFANGCRDRFDDGMYLSYCRQGCTNYMDLIGDLDELSAEDQIYFVHVRQRIDELISRKLLDMSHDYIDQLFPNTREQRQHERSLQFTSDHVEAMILASLEPRREGNNGNQAGQQRV
jgi:hypothetical protein